ncbi:hypothetical protein BXZ70DRAFT_998957 [Cristinia sonorae]|uniref:RING-type domain-containing protein n=1 Tax=Cristinia sonorae TaxID=1940300 RepID=A0A8K0UV16_9AGAR|nr:hypothetical protein BXZ70DRAFT_998957 [Cristinia sonorae]
MITLSPSSLCDVCAEEYGPHNYPHCIPCGHVLCLSCCNSIIQKTHPKHAPACPFCRESFASDAVRMIRIDFSPSGSGWSTPRQQCLAGVYDNIVDDTEDDVLISGFKTRTDAKVLEHKVARIAAKKCSVEEVQALHKELQEWLAVNKQGDKSTSLHLSALLLRAILMNHIAHSEATKSQRNIERQLRDQVDQAEAGKAKLDSELRSLRSQFSQTAQECQSLRSELSRYKTTSSGYSSPASSRSPSVTPTSPRSRATSPTSPTPYQQPVHSSVPPSRMSSTTTPTRPSSVAPMRSNSVAPPSLRSMTPSVRSGAYTPSPHIVRSESARPSTPAKTRSMSISGHIVTPTKMMRSMSSESSSDEIQTQKDEAKERQREKDSKRVQLIQRWMPSLETASPPTGRSGFLPSMGRSSMPTSQPSTPGRSRTISNASAAFAPPHRYKTPIPVNAS